MSRTLTLVLGTGEVYTDFTVDSQCLQKVKFVVYFPGFQFLSAMTKRTRFTNVRDSVF